MSSIFARTTETPRTIALNVLDYLDARLRTLDRQLEDLDAQRDSLDRELRHADDADDGDDDDVAAAREEHYQDVLARLAARGASYDACLAARELLDNALVGEGSDALRACADLTGLDSVLATAIGSALADVNFDRPRTDFRAYVERLGAAA